jgi:hypothetical protein
MTGNGHRGSKVALEPTAVFPNHHRKLLPLVFAALFLILVERTMSGSTRELLDAYVDSGRLWNERTATKDGPLSSFSRHFDNVFVAVNTNADRFYYVLRHVDNFYSPIFNDRILYYGPSAANESGFPAVRALDTKGWLMAYRAILATIRDHPEATGILYTNDDTAMDVFRMARLPLDKLWYNLALMSNQFQFVDTIYDPPMNPAYSVRNAWAWRWHGLSVGKAMKEFSERWMERIRRAAEAHGNSNLSMPAVASLCDFIYIPNKLFKPLEKGLRIMEKHEVMLEIAVATVVVAISEMTEWEPLDQVYLYDKDIEQAANITQKGGWDIIHPVKLSLEGNRKALEGHLKAAPFDERNKRII